MNAVNYLQGFLVVHLIGFTLMAGTIVVDFSIHRRLNRILFSDRQKGLAMLDSTAGFPALIGLGALLLVTTGIGMVVIMKGVFVKMLWFRIKMILVVLIGVNGSLIPRQNTARLRVLLAGNAPENDSRIGAIKNRLSIFHASQFILFLVIFILSIFKF